MTEALQVMILTSGKRLLDHRDVKGLKRHQQAFQIHSRPGFIGIDNERRTRGRRTNRRHFFQNRIAVKLDFEQDGTPRDGIAAASAMFSSVSRLRVSAVTTERGGGHALCCQSV